MSLKKVSKTQPELFKFSADNLQKANKEIKKYPKNRKASSVIALLYLVQNQNDNWIPLAAIKYVAGILDMPYIKVYEVVTFYSMFNLSPVGKYFVQVCTTTPCWLRGSENIVKACKEIISENQCDVAHNNLFSWMEVECLGACVNAPMIQINDDFYEDLDYESTKNILQSLIDNKPLKIGSQIGRLGSRGANNAQ